MSSDDSLTVQNCNVLQFDPPLTYSESDDQTCSASWRKSYLSAFETREKKSNFENAFQQMIRANILVIVQLVIHAERLSRIYCCCKAIFEFYLKGWDELGRPSSLSVSFFPKVSFFVKNQFDGKHNNQVSYFSR